MSLGNGRGCQALGFVRGDAGESEDAESEAVGCDKCATVSLTETDFPERIRGDGHVGLRSENPRVGGSIPPLGTHTEIVSC